MNYVYGKTRVKFVHDSKYRIEDEINKALDMIQSENDVVLDIKINAPGDGYECMALIIYKHVEGNEQEGRV